MAAEVRVLLDPEDDVQVSVGLLESHDPARGRVIVHPTPGTSSAQALAHDLLGALGRAVNRLDAEQLAGPPAWRAVTAWMVTGQIEDLVVLRADRLSAAAWTRALGLGQDTGCRVLLVCHTRQIPAHLDAALAGTGYQLLAGLQQALHGARPHPRPRPDAAAAGGPDAADLPRFLHPHIRNYRSKAFAQLGPAGFARTDAVYRHGRDAACHWLSTRPGPGRTAVSGQRVQLFLTWLVHDSPSRHHTLARLRGAQAGFRLHGLMLSIPPSQRLLEVLSGPGLNAPLVTAQTAGRIRAGVAHPVIAAGLAVVLVTGVQALALASTPWDALSPGNDALRLTWQPSGRMLIPASLAATAGPATTAVFHVPAAARPLLQAARHFSRSAPGHRAAARLFAATPFTNERIGAAAANCKITLPAQPSLAAMWQTGVTCTRAGYLGTRFDSSFKDDQDFEPGCGAVAAGRRLWPSGPARGKEIAVGGHRGDGPGAGGQGGPRGAGLAQLAEVRDVVVEGTRADAEEPGYGGDGMRGVRQQVAGCGDDLGRGDDGPAAGAAALAGGGQALAGPRDDELADELGQRGEDVEHQPPAGGGGVQGLVQRREPHPAAAQVRDGGDQVLQRAGEPVQGGHHEGVARLHELQRGAQLAPVGVLAGLLVGEDTPAPGRGERVDLPVELLPARGHPRVADPDAGQLRWLGAGQPGRLGKRSHERQCLRKRCSAVVDDTGFLKEF